MNEPFLQLLRDFLSELGKPALAFHVTENSSLEKDLGLGSLERVEFISRIETEFHIHLPENVVADAETVGDVLRAIPQANVHHVPAPVRAAAADQPRRTFACNTAANLVEAFYLHCRDTAGHVHIHVQADDGEGKDISFAELGERACTLGAQLRALDVAPGDRVAIMLPTGEEFFYSFLGVWLAHAVPVPIYPPARVSRIEEYATRQASILRNGGAVVLITFAESRPLARLLAPDVPSLRHVVTAERLLAQGVAAGWPALPKGDAMPALIQYTSGSTGDPKGVLLTHANLLANIRALGNAVRIDASDSTTCWLPLYHDMGLIGCWLLSLYFGIPITVMSPLAFLSRPERWLWAVHYNRSTLSAAPNFAYELCTRKIRHESIEGLDLSCWRAALNGSEAVRPETIRRFTERFGRYGFRPEAMLPVYGLAESTVGLCGPVLGRPPLIDRIRREPFEREARAERATGSDLEFVSAGQPLDGHQIRIVNDSLEPAGERRVGRIQFRGPSSMSGYFGRPDATEAIRFGDWLDSGDLGYFANGELYITGRAKDVIIKAGRNLYPEEIERAVAEVEGVRKGCVAAFGLADPAQGTEKLIVVAETRLGDPAQVEAMRSKIESRLMELLGVPADEIVFIQPGTLPKTSSGKLRRGVCRDSYQRGELGREGRAVMLQWFRLVARWMVLGIKQSARRMARFSYAIYLYGMLIPAGLGCWIAMLAAASGDPARKRMRRLSRLMLRVALLRVEVTQAEELPPGPLVIVANHTSYFDVLVLAAALSRDLTFVAKRQLFGVPIMRTFLTRTAAVLVERGSTVDAKADSARIEASMRSGNTIAIFPEGTFTSARGLRPFRLGAFQLAAQVGCAIVPVAIDGLRGSIPGLTPRRTRVRVDIGAAIRPEAYDWHEVIRLRDAAFARIAAHCGEPPIDVRSMATPKHDLEG